MSWRVAARPRAAEGYAPAQDVLRIRPMALPHLGFREGLGIPRKAFGKTPDFCDAAVRLKRPWLLHRSHLRPFGY